MKAVHLRTSGMKEPIGIDLKAPLLTWHCEDGIQQTAYRVLAKDEAGETLFDSGKVLTSSMRCPWNGQKWRSRQRVTWQVCLWDEKEKETWSEEAHFEMGLLEKEDWQAQWITGVNTDTLEHLPADCYLRTFEARKPVSKARLYATALGVYSAFMNDRRVSDVLSPGTTDYHCRLHYQTYDVTDALCEGENRLTFCVADGWYKGHNGAEREDCVYGQQLKLLAQLEITYLDGTKETICTDSSFQWSNDGPVRAADLGDGECYDARMKPSFSEKARVDGREHRTLCASNAPPIREHECFSPSLERSPSGKAILNFGQNMAGYVNIHVHQPAGTKIILRLFEAKDHGEYSNVTLSFPNGNAETVAQRIECVANGEDFIFQPEFFYSGFQYALVDGLDIVEPQDFQGVAIYSDLEFDGDFTCSNLMVNQFVRNTRWSMKSNFIGVPTDCPQREKAGWTGDAQLFCKTAGWFADTAAFFRKWLRDMADTQRADGCVVNVCPRQTHPGNRAEALNGSVGWGDAAVIIPYTVWKETGDDGVIRDSLDMMLKWKAYMQRLCADKSLYSSLPDGHPMKPMQPMLEAFLLPDSPYNRYIPEAGAHWGEWCVPASEEPSDENPMISLIKPKQELTCAYTHYSMTLLAEMLEAIGEESEAASCREYAEGAMKAYHVHWVKEGKVSSDHMAELVRPIALGLLTPEEEQATADELNRMAIRRGYKVGTGFLSTPFVLQVLAKHGHVDTAYRMLENTTAPGWLAMVRQGATTVWEEYECYDGDGSPLPHSMNHYSPGAVCGFLFDTVCGIHVSEGNRIIFRPLPGGSLISAEASAMTMYGPVKSGWTKEGESTSYSFSVPANVKATVEFPDGRTAELTPGETSVIVAAESSGEIQLTVRAE